MEDIVKEISQQIQEFIDERWFGTFILKKGIYVSEDTSIFNFAVFLIGFNYFKLVEPKLNGKIQQLNIDVVYGLVCEIFEIIYSIESCIKVGSMITATILIRAFIERVLLIKILFGRKNSLNKRITYFIRYNDFLIYNRKKTMKKYLSKLLLENPTKLKKGTYAPFFKISDITNELANIDSYLKVNKRKYLSLEKKYKHKGKCFRYNPIFKEKNLSISCLLKKYNYKDFNVWEDLNFYGVLSESVHTQYISNKTNCNYGYIKDEKEVKRDIAIITRLFLSSLEELFLVFSNYTGDDSMLKFYSKIQTKNYKTFKINKTH